MIFWGLALCQFMQLISCLGFFLCYRLHLLLLLSSLHSCRVKVAALVLQTGPPAFSSCSVAQRLPVTWQTPSFPADDMSMWAVCLYCVCCLFYRALIDLIFIGDGEEEGKEISSSCTSDTAASARGFQLWCLGNCVPADEPTNSRVGFSVQMLSHLPSTLSYRESHDEGNKWHGLRMLYRDSKEIKSDFERIKCFDFHDGTSNCPWICCAPEMELHAKKRFYGAQAIIWWWRAPKPALILQLAS